MNELTLMILRNYGISVKSQDFMELLPSPQSSSRNKNFVSTTKNFLKTKNLTFPKCTISHENQSLFQIFCE